MAAIKSSQGLALLVLAFVLTGCFAFGPRAPGEALDVSSTPWAISTSSAHIRIGELKFLAGVELKSNDSDFGGYSGLALINDGQAMIAISDRGHWLAAELDLEDGILTGLGRVQSGLLPNGGKASSIGRGDAEALAIVEEVAYVPFEGINSILRFDAKSGFFAQSGVPLPVPEEFKNAPRNRGVEALAAISPGQLFALSERPWKEDSRYTLGWLVEDDKRFVPFKYPRSGSFKPSDATFVEGDGIYVLERNYRGKSGPSMRIVRVGNIHPGPDNVIETSELAVARGPLRLDNMEGIAGYKRADGRTVLYVISDNNFSSLQRTLLFQFLVEPASNGLNSAVLAK